MKTLTCDTRVTPQTLARVAGVMREHQVRANTISEIIRNAMRYVASMASPELVEATRDAEASAEYLKSCGLWSRQMESASRVELSDGLSEAMQKRSQELAALLAGDEEDVD